MPSQKTTYTLQIVLMLAVFFFVLFNLVFKLIVEIKSESKMKIAQQIKTEQMKSEFIAGIDDKYNQVLNLFDGKEYEKAIEIIKNFNKYGKSDYKELPEIKKEIRMFYLKKKLENIPKIHLNEYLQLSKDIDIQEDDSTEVFIRSPRYGQYFYPSDLPIRLEGIALSVTGDFSENIVWASNVDGELGKGKRISVRLSFGEHQITATGSNGITTGSMSTRVFIERNPDFLKHYSRE